MKFFVSYSRNEKHTVEKIVKLLRVDGHEVWWDQDIPEIADWWSTILDNIESCKVFLFFISEQSVKYPYCLAELDYARRRNRPILPFMLDDYKSYTIPDGIIERQQWYKYNDDPPHLLERISAISQKIDWKQYQDIYAARPAEPNKGSESLTKQFQQAVSLAEDGQYKQAVRLFRNVSSLDFEEWGEECQRWIGRVQLYEDIMELVSHSVTLERAKRKWMQYSETYGITFDPFAVAQKVEGDILYDKTKSISTPKEAVLSIAGQWIDKSDGDTVYFVQNGRKVVGIYDFGRNQKVGVYTGNLKGDTLYYEWRWFDDNLIGNGRAKLSNDRRVLVGEWWYSNDRKSTESVSYHKVSDEMPHWLTNYDFKEFYSFLYGN